MGSKKTQIIGLIDQRHVLIKLVSAHDLARVWTIESYQMEGALFRVFKWKRNFRLGVEPPISLVWASFRHQLLHLLLYESSRRSTSKAFGHKRAYLDSYKALICLNFL